MSPRWGEGWVHFGVHGTRGWEGKRKRKGSAKGKGILGKDERLARYFASF